MKVEMRIAAEEVPYGRPVRAEGDACAVSILLSDMIGIAARPRFGLASSDNLYREGETVTIVTDGGCRTDLAVDAEIRIAGAPVERLLAFEPHYFQLAKGKIIGRI